MKIEKINENQIRCTLSREELADRQIKLSELAYGSEKARGLFQDMIEQANDQFGFEVNDIPLMIEAIPLAGEKIILQITKVEYPDELDTRFSKFSEGEEAETLDDMDTIFSQVQGADDILGIFRKMKEDLKQAEEKEESSEKTQLSEKQENLEEIKNFTNMFEFESLEQMERLAHVLGGYFHGESDIYKDEMKNRLYLLLRKCNHLPEEFNRVCNIVSEYGNYRKYTKAAEAYLKEHGKLILKNKALETLDLIHETK